MKRGEVQALALFFSLLELPVVTEIKLVIDFTLSTIEPNHCLILDTFSINNMLG